MQTRPGYFTLCPSVPVAGVPVRGTRTIVTDSLSLQSGQYLANILSRSTGFRFAVVTNSTAGPVRGAILLTTVNASTNYGTEGYQLSVAPDSVIVSASAQSGVFYGVQTLLQLFPPQILSLQPVTNVAWTAPCVLIQDQPRFSWRGVMLDVTRHFFDKQEVERVLDALALHKINTLHLHLCDDQGWRIQINSEPQLTTTGAWRGSMDYGLNPASSTAFRAGGTPYGGYYTQNDVREMVTYAQQRHITIVPEIEMPAHSTAGLASYTNFSCGYLSNRFDMDSINYGVSLYSLARPGSWTFFTNILTEVMSLFPSQYIHCGGDEVTATGDMDWTTYSYDANQMTALGISTSGGDASLIAYQHWFSTNLSAFLQANGRTMIGWSEYEAGGTVPNAALMDWGTGTSSYAVQVAEAGLPVVMTPDSNLYINYCETYGNPPYSFSAPFGEPYFIVGGTPSYSSVTNVYNFEPVPSSLTGPSTNNIIGAQCNLWTEYVPSPENVEFKLFPRVCALAELTWSPKASKNFTNFQARLVPHEQRLSALGINYNHEAVTQIGTWGPTVSTSGSVVSYTITPYVTANGEIDINFYYTSGADAVKVTSVSLLENGTQISVDNHTGNSGGYEYLANTSDLVPYFVLHLPWFHPGSTYTIQATITGQGGTASNGTVYLVNWN
jgi:hexosaminidase